MRTAISIAALAAGALAVPYKRDDPVYTDWDVVYVTDVVTVTAGQAPPEYTSASSVSVAQHYGHHNGWHSSSSTPSTEVVIPTSTSSSTPAYTPPETSTSTTPVYVAPTTISTSTTPVIQIPETTYAPLPTSTYVAETTYAPLPASTYVAPISSAAPSTSASAGSYGSADPTYAQSVLDSHNLHRSNHSASDIDWDDDLYTIAMEIGATCNYAHNTEMGGGGYGQNIAAGVDSSNIMSVITDMFYNGEEWQFADAGLYGQANPDMSNFESWGHFTQLVWKGTTHVACYTTTTDVCPTIYSVNSDGSRGDALSSLIPPYFTVCNYKTPGNYAGEYADNVGEPLGEPIAYAATESS